MVNVLCSCARYFFHSQGASLHPGVWVGAINWWLFRELNKLPDIFPRGANPHITVIPHLLKFYSHCETTSLILQFATAHTCAPFCKWLYINGGVKIGFCSLGCHIGDLYPLFELCQVPSRYLTTEHHFCDEINLGRFYPGKSIPPGIPGVSRVGSRLFQVGSRVGSRLGLWNILHGIAHGIPLGIPHGITHGIAHGILPGIMEHPAWDPTWDPTWDPANWSWDPALNS